MTAFSDLEGKTLDKVEVQDNEIYFESNCGQVWKLFHSPVCCESVTIESITGDLADLIKTPILLAEEASSSDDPQDVKDAKAAEKAKDPNYWDLTDSQTWTFYKLRTIKGSVDIRWHGSSNGYYSESVEFEELTEWVPVRTKVSMPVFIENEAKGKMRMIDNKVHTLKRK